MSDEDFGKPPNNEANHAGLSPEMLSQMEGDAGLGVSAKPDEEVGDDPDPLSGTAFGPTFLEHLLLGIIRGNPIRRKGNPYYAKTERQRLDGVMKALVEDKRSGNPPSDDADDSALLWMKTEELRRRRRGTKTTNRGLAIEAASKFIPGFDAALDMSPADRLREKFSGTYDKKRAKGRRIDVPRTLAYRVSQHDYIVESIEAQMLRRIAAELQAAGVRVILPD